MLAAIDIGSNTVQLLLAETQRPAAAGDNGVRLGEKQNYIWTTRLGSAGPDGRLSAEAIADTAAAVGEAMAKARLTQAYAVRILATSATRDAANSGDLQAAIYAAAPDAPPMEILSGIQEAELSFAGACVCCGEPAGWPVIDQGGSSTELIYALPTGKLDCVSCNIGAVRAHKQGWGWDEINRRVAEGYSRKNDAPGAIGVGGTITTAAGIFSDLTTFDRKKIEGYSIKRSELDRLLRQLLPLDIPARCASSPLLTRRGEVFCEGLMIWLALMDTLRLETIRVTAGGILDGAAAQMLK